MPNPADAFAGRSTTSTVVSSSGVEQFRRSWPADEPRANVLLIHGIAEHSGRYEHVGTTLASVGLSTRSYDHHGFGRSGGARGHVDSWSVYLDDVEENLTELRAEALPVVLIGHSMGGLVAFTYAVADRPQPDVLVLSSPALGATIPAWKRIGAPILSRVVPRLFITEEFDGSLLTSDPDVTEAYGSDPLRVRGATPRLGAEILEAMKQANERVDRLSVPTLVTHGSDDPIVPPEFSAPIGAQPMASRVVLDGLRHETLNEPSWKTTLQLIIDFIDENLP